MDTYDGRKRFTASEREGVMRLNLMTALAIESLEALEGRTKAVRSLRRDLKMIAAVGTRLLKDVLSTAPPEQYKSIRQNVQMCSYVIGAKRPGQNGQRVKDYGTWVSFESLAILIGGLEDHCMMCDFDREHEMRCPIRKTLDMIGSDVTHDHGCGYREHIV